MREVLQGLLQLAQELFVQGKTCEEYLRLQRKGEFAEQAREVVQKIERALAEKKK